MSVLRGQTFIVLSDDEEDTRQPSQEAFSREKNDDFGQTMGQHLGQHSGQVTVQSSKSNQIHSPTQEHNARNPESQEQYGTSQNFNGEDTGSQRPEIQAPNSPVDEHSITGSGSRALNSSDDSIVVISDDEHLEPPRRSRRIASKAKTVMDSDSDGNFIVESDPDENIHASSKHAESPSAKSNHTVQENSRAIVPNSFQQESQPPQSVPRPASPMEVDDPMDVDSDDEIAVLSKEEAERIGTFKKTSFEANPQSYSSDPPSSHPGFNQPAPVYHAGEHASAAQTNESIAQDRSIRNYFDPFSLPELQQHENNLGRQLSGLTAARDSVLNEITKLRNQLSKLDSENYTERNQLMRAISEKLDQAEDTIQRSKKVRKYMSILASVKDIKMYPQKYTPQGYDYASIGANQAPYAQIPGAFPGQGSFYSQGTASGLFNQYAQGVAYGQEYAQNIYNPGMGVYGQTSQNFNPYMNVSAPNADQVHLEQLFNDIYKEEDVKGMAPTPDTLSCQLFDHQRQGLNWLLKKEQSKSGCILADDMGLGKTVQTIALIESNKSNEESCKTTLIVGPVSLLRQWDAELRKKIKSKHALKVFSFIGKDRKRNNTFHRLKRYDVVLVSYSTLASEFKQHFAQALEEAQVTKHQNLLPDSNSGGRTYKSPFYSKESVFFRIVLDEAQSIKNKLSLTSKSVACLKGVHRLCLTGTPMQNNVEELYPILRFLRSKPYDDEKKFKIDILVPLKSNHEDVDDYEINQSMRKLRAVLSAIMLRRTKNSKVDGKPLLQLPEKEVELVYVTMESEEKAFYSNLEQGIQNEARKLMETSASSGNFLVLLLRLRQACIHQILVQVGEFKHDERRKTVDWDRMYHLIKTMGSQAKRNVGSVLEGTPGKSESPQITSEEVVEIVDDEADPFEGKEAQLTCPVCLDVAGESSIVVFSECGHTICDGCVEDFFALSEDDGQTAPCMVCKTRVQRSGMVDYSVFSKVVYEGWDYGRMSRMYNLSSAKKLTSSQKFAAVLGPDKKFSMSAKLGKVVELVEKITSDTPDEKIIVFSHFVITFDLLQLLFERKGIKYLRYDGSMNIDEKNAAISKFYEGSARVLLISLKAGNVGLTLTCANHVVLMDPFWNPYVEEQAMDRAHRLGQERPVKVYRLLIKNSVEDRITDLQQRKKELIGSVMDENALKSSSSLGRKELGYLFGLNSLQ